jgi:hypothetical protein
MRRRLRGEARVSARHRREVREPSRELLFSPFQSARSSRWTVSAPSCRPISLRTIRWLGESQGPRLARIVGSPNRRVLPGGTSHPVSSSRGSQMSWTHVLRRIHRTCASPVLGGVDAFHCERGARIRQPGESHPVELHLRGKEYNRTLVSRDMFWHTPEEELQHEGELTALYWQLDFDLPVGDWDDWKKNQARKRSIRHWR